MKTSYKTLLACTVAMMIAPATSASAESTRYWGGASWAEDAAYAYFGGTHALNGDLSKDGHLVRLGLGYGDYHYNSVAVPGTTVDGDTQRIDAMVGYQKFFPTWRVTGYVGADYIHHDISPNDPNNSVDGTEFGVKGQIELVKQWDDKHVIDVAVNASTAYNTFWSRGRVTRDMGGFTFGPEVTILGSESFDQTRVGVHIGEVQWIDAFDLNFQLGYMYAGRRGDDSAYVNVGFSDSF